MARSLITGTITTGVTLTSAAYTDPVTIASAAHLSGHGVSAATFWVVDNDGHISAGRGTGIVLTAGGSVTNGVGATIAAYGGVAAVKGAGNVLNEGVIVAYGHAGVSLRKGGSLTNAANASIYSGYAGVYGSLVGPAISVHNQGSLKGLRFGAVFRDGGDLTNAAGGAITSVGDTAVYAAGRRFNHVVNAGHITGYDTGVFLGVSGGSVVNNAGALITGTHKDGVLASGPATVWNAGTITGGKDAVYFDAGGANRLIKVAGAAFHGAVHAIAGGSNVIELASSANAGTLAGLGSEYTGFQTVTIDAGAAWTVAGAKAGFSGVTIGGFGSKDALVMTDVAFATGEKATINASDVLTVTNAGGATLVTAHLSGNFSGAQFAVASNGAGGIRITESGVLAAHSTGSEPAGVSLTAAPYSFGPEPRLEGLLGQFAAAGFRTAPHGGGIMLTAYAPAPAALAISPH